MEVKAGISDNELVELLRYPESLDRGFRMLLQKYQEKLYWHVRRMVVSHDDANDVMQNVFIKVYRHIGKFKGDSSLYTWLYRIASNESLTYLKKMGRNATVDIETEEGAVLQLKSDEYFDGDSTMTLLKAAVKCLPEKQKLVFNLRYFEEMSYKDLAVVCGGSIGGLKASFHHAVKKIEEYLKNNVE